jgi:hypothetical protein
MFLEPSGEVCLLRINRDKHFEMRSVTQCAERCYFSVNSRSTYVGTTSLALP